MLLEHELLYFLRLSSIFLLLLVAFPLKTYFKFLMKPTTIMVSIMLTIILYCSKIIPSLLIRFFKKGSEVILGSSGRMARVLGVCGLGRNYVMMRVQELGGILEGETVIQRMVVSSPPTLLWLVLLQVFVSRLFKPILGLMLDFVHEDRIGCNMDEV